jgi:hypothetical protein
MGGSSYWAGVLSRVNVAGIVLVLIGAAVCFGASKLAHRFTKNPEKTVLPLKIGGLALAMVGALITFFIQ